MICKLHIKNYAIIEELELQFTKGLNIITGETGAGKSILMGAMGLILGNRADSSVLYDSQSKCIVEGFFQLDKDEEIRSFCIENELDYESDLVIRREIASNGKSRTFINDTPVNLAQVKSLCSLLVDLHQQFDTQEIYSQDFQCSVLDALSDHHSLLVELKSKFVSYTQIAKELSQHRDNYERASKEADYNLFLLEELSALSLKSNELEELEEELKLLSNAEQIKQQLSFIIEAMASADQPLVQQAKQLNIKLSALSKYHNDIGVLSERLGSAVIEFQDIADELEAIESKLNLDAERMTLINERLSAGYTLFKKHHVNSTKDLLDIQLQLEDKSKHMELDAGKISALEQEAEKLYSECIAKAQQVSVNRKASVPNFEKQTNALLKKVGMPNASIEVRLKDKTLSLDGTDEVMFLFDANKSGRMEPLGKVASGGELSRLMLSIKSLVAQKLELPTLIFDEIDTGISGEAAKQVGQIMRSLGSAHQIIAITHQPQIAAKANTHFFVNKVEAEGRLVTKVKTLDQQERINSIAKMLSGDKPTEAALENAKEMLMD
jgi:DNA repair protein RecN (Recombination protein N)